ncbi:hypothetical protein PK98_13570 [Croceibacterium mercuriale]|uniref:Uncharacterized protein n=2 Tax=Croceibacterium mercuriale TaxID=1572751 RepID=A0A0B2BYH7_9SPHN|nr:hypothetical protein PK98_13570 [Croceibacterium mercuriale]
MLVATWFVADQQGEGTWFPQIGGNSADAGAKAIYWRCVVTFYATSLQHNPHNPHAFFTNTDLPSVDGIDIAALFARWGVEVIRLPITYRIPLGRVDSWGNQFYIFDIIDHCARSGRWPSVIVLDSDVVWTSAAEPMERQVTLDGALSYVHDLDAYPAGEQINGVTREQLVRFMARHGGPVQDTMVYCGGEIFCATLPAMIAMADRVPALWQAILAGEEDAPKEEAHLLSLLYVMEGYPLGNADPFIKRMWTTFKHNNLVPGDERLAIWHLPAEKRSGFPALFARLKGHGLERRDPLELAVSREEMGRIFGVPRRSPAKWLRDMRSKVSEHAGKRLAGAR